MNFSFFTNKFSTLRNVITVIATMTLTACASLDTWFKQADSPLPIEVQHSGGRIMSFRAHETSDRLYVTGSAKEHLLKARGHVDVQLIGPAGHVIAEKYDNINPAHVAPGGGKYSSRRGRHHIDSYVVSFPLTEARRAAKIRVIYHFERHDT